MTNTQPINDMSLNNIAVAVVTYNRRKDLMICIEALLNQTLLPDEIIIINNQSPDDTESHLLDAGFIRPDNSVQTEFGNESTIVHKSDSGKSVKITYILKSENDGGAGGFYAGMKTAYDKGYEWILLMDDDGRPDKDEINHLLAASLKHALKYANALVINRDNPAELAFDLLKTPIESDYYLDKELITDCGSPFNGTFINRSLIDRIGFIKKEMFIWGDEAEYTARAKEAGFPIATVCQARHFHPKTGKTLNMIPFVKRWSILSPDTKRAGIFYRNQCFIFTRYRKRKSLYKFIARNIIGAFMNLQWRYIPNMISAMKCGIKADFSRKLY